MTNRKLKIAPDYISSCCNCDNYPVVTFVYEDTGALETDTEMCGVCYFGEAECVDPEEWPEVINDE